MNYQEGRDVENLEEHRVDIFKPILESNKKLQNEIIDEKNKIVETLNSFKDSNSLTKPKAITLNQTSSPPLKEIDTNSSKVDTTITVSNLFASYLQDNSDKSNAGYSLRFDKNEKKYTIGNKDIFFDQNTIQINNVVYTATLGLLELLTKKSLNLKKIKDDDTQNYREILVRSLPCCPRYRLDKCIQFFFTQGL